MSYCASYTFSAPHPRPSSACWEGFVASRETEAIAEEKLPKAEGCLCAQDHVQSRRTKQPQRCGVSEHFLFGQGSFCLGDALSSKTVQRAVPNIVGMAQKLHLCTDQMVIMPQSFKF